jgi:hypothetical protein
MFVLTYFLVSLVFLLMESNIDFVHGNIKNDVKPSLTAHGTANNLGAFPTKGFQPR